MKILNKENFIGYVYDITFEYIYIYILEKLKEKNHGLSQNTILLIGKKNLEGIISENEFLVVRLNNIITNPSSMNNTSRLFDIYSSKSEGINVDIDLKTRASLNNSSFECKILGTIIKNKDKYRFGSDISNFNTPYNYVVFKPQKEELTNIIKIIGDNKPEDNWVEYGKIRYSSSNYDTTSKDNVPFYISANDILAHRTALFGMTRTGKSNSLKNLIDTVEQMKTKDLTIGQIIFDVNGEYANDNVQDDNSIYSKYKSNVKRYSFIELPGFDMMKVNFFDDKNGGLKEGHSLIKVLLKDLTLNADYFQNFLSIEFDEALANIKSGTPSDKVRSTRLVALYKCILYKAGFKTNLNSLGKIDFSKELKQALGISPVTERFTIDEAINIFTDIWSKYKAIPYFNNYPATHEGKEWASEEMKSLLIMLTGAKNPGGESSVSGFKKISRLKDYHTSEDKGLFSENIIKDLSNGKIVIVDLSLGEDEIKKLYSEKLTSSIFEHNKSFFTSNKKPTNIQMYFEEAHNLFPTGESDLTQIYNRVAKEGAKYNIGLIYATQEVSSISRSILKNTENWFISHLNNDSELSILSSYYDFKDFTKSLKNFSNSTDKGYSKIKMLSYPFTFPVQINKF